MPQPGQPVAHFYGVNIGDLRPGSSPAAINYAPKVVFTPSSVLTLEVGGLAPGTQHDKLTFTHSGTPQVEWGGTLNIELINGFTPAAGQSFDVFDFDAARDAGTFFSIPVFPGASEPGGGLHVYPEGERMRVLFWRQIDRNDITIRVQVSTDLVEWNDLAVSVNSAPFTGACFVSENRAHP